MSKVPALYTIERLRILYRIYFEKYGYLKPHIRSFLEWVDSRGEKTGNSIQDNSLRP